MDSQASEGNPPSTQPSGKSSIVYKWVILFLFDENTEFPFSCVSTASLEGSNFPFNVINGSMDAELRKEPIQLDALEGSKRFCIFAKIEEGTLKSQSGLNSLSRKIIRIKIIFGVRD